MEAELTAFQRDAERAVRAVAEEVGVEVLAREILTGEVPFYSKDLQTYVRLRVGRNEIWLFDDEASFSGPLGHQGLEREDFDSSEALLRELVASLRQHF